MNSKDVKTFTQIALEHNRMPGVFDYNYDQNFYSHHNDIDQETYLVLGDRNSKYAHEHFEMGSVQDETNKF